MCHRPSQVSGPCCLPLGHRGLRWRCLSLWLMGSTWCFCWGGDLLLLHSSFVCSSYCCCCCPFQHPLTTPMWWNVMVVDLQADADGPRGGHMSVMSPSIWCSPVQPHSLLKTSERPSDTAVHSSLFSFSHRPCDRVSKATLATHVHHLL